MRAARLLATLVFALILPLAGCVVPGSENARPFEPVAAPVWEPGYSWGYKVSMSESATRIEDGQVHRDSNTNEASSVITVINATEPFLGEGVYYVKADGESPFPFQQGNVQALSQKDLTVAGFGHFYEYAIAEPVEAGAPEDVAGPYPAYPPCEPVVSLTPVDRAARFPGVPFPLDDGQRANGVLFGEGHEFEGMHYGLRVLGMEYIETPAGAFEAVHLRIDLIPPAGGMGDGVFDIHFTIDYWYSEAARYFVRYTATAQASGQDPDGGSGSFSGLFSMTADLVSFSLERGAEEPAPPPYEYEEPYRYEYREFEVMSDTEFPVNIADGPVAAEFWLSEARAEWMDDDAEPADESTVHSVDYDREKYEVVWRVSTFYQYYQRPDEFVGDVLAFNLEKGGLYVIEAELRAKACGYPSVGTGRRDASAYWERSYRIQTEVGGQQLIDVDKFPVENGAASGLATWKFVPSTVTPVDKGHPILIAPDGRIENKGYGSNQQAQFHPFTPGTWTLRWDTEGVTVGDDVMLTLRVNYDGGVYY